MLPKTSKTTASRYQNSRISYDEAQVYGIIDDALFATVSYAEREIPYSIPQSIVRIGNYVYIHGSVGSHLMRTIADGRKVCISIMHADAIVVAKSAFEHSINYRSVVLFANGEVVKNQEEKALAFKTLTEKMVPNSWDYLRPMTQKEMDKTTAVKFKIEEASAKVRSGEPSFDLNDAEEKLWTGLIPLETKRGTPQADSRSKNIPTPKHLK